MTCNCQGSMIQAWILSSGSRPSWSACSTRCNGKSMIVVSHVFLLMKQQSHTHVTGWRIRSVTQQVVSLSRTAPKVNPQGRHARRHTTKRCWKSPPTFFLLTLASLGHHQFRLTQSSFSQADQNMTIKAFSPNGFRHNTIYLWNNTTLFDTKALFLLTHIDCKHFRP